jgi:hypothetical protein
VKDACFVGSSVYGVEVMALGPSPSVASRRVAAVWALIDRPRMAAICIGLLIFALGLMPDSGNRFKGFAEFIQAAAWPVVVVAAFIMFRTSVGELLTR